MRRWLRLPLQSLQLQELQLVSASNRTLGGSRACILFMELE